MSQGRILAIAFIAVGVILAAVSALADVFLGARGTVFGWKQLLGLVVGIVLVVAGIILLRQGEGEYEDDEEYEDEDEAAEEVAGGERRA
jgi:uncharacterized membrane protein